MSFSHHESFEESEARARLLDQFLNKAQQSFQDGRLNRKDEGELAFAIATDPENQVVIIKFGKPVAWVGMPKRQALELAALLTEHAASLK